jgi:hypothetical protein
MTHVSWRSESLGYTCTGYLRRPFLERKKMEVNKEQGRESSYRQGCFSSLFPVTASLSKKLDFIPIMFPRDFVHYSPLS